MLTRYLSADEVIQLTGWPRPAFAKAATTWLPKELRVKTGPTYEFAPVTVAYLRLVQILRGSFGEQSKIPGELAAKALPQLARMLASDKEPSDSLTIQGDLATQIDIRSPFMTEVREQLRSL